MIRQQRLYLVFLTTLLILLNGISSAAAQVEEEGSIGAKGEETVSIGSADRLDKVSDNLEKALNAASGKGLVVRHSEQEVSQPGGKSDLRKVTLSSVQTPRCTTPKIFSFPEEVKPEEAPVVENTQTPRRANGYDKITELGKDFINENGFYSQSVGIALGRAFLAQGLGEEARAIALLLHGEEADLLAQMGDIVAEIDLPTHASLRGSGACFGADMPWRIMANMVTQPEKILDLTPAYLSYFEDLPEFLTFDFSTRLAVLATERKNFDLAQDLVELAQSYPYFSSPRLTYAEAFLLAQKGNMQGVSSLISLAREEGEMQAKALFALGDIEDLGKISNYENYITDVEAVSEKYVEGDKSDLALFYEIRALATSGRFLTAIERLNSNEGLSASIKHDATSVIGSQLVMALLDEDDDRRLPALSAYLKHKELFNLNTDQQINLLKEAIKLSHALALPDLSLDLMAKLPAEQQSMEEKYINAWAHMEKGNPQKAFDEARSFIESIAFLEIAVKSLLDLGLESEAIALFEKLPPSEQREKLKARLAWAYNAWGAAADSYGVLAKTTHDEDAKVKRNLSAYMGERTLQAEETDDTDIFTTPYSPARNKAQIEGLIEQSRQETDAIEEFLNRG